MSAWICHHPGKVMSFSITVRNALEPWTTLLCRPELTVGTANTEAVLPKCRDVSGSWSSSGRWQHSIAKGKAGMVTTIDGRAKAAIRTV